MKGIVITSKGVEEAACLEIRGLINAKCKPEDGCVIFDFKSFKDLCLLCYKSQSIDRVLYFIGNFEFGDFFEELEKFIGNLKLDEWIGKCSNFKVECIRIGSHDFNSVEVETKISKLIIKRFRDKKINLKDYEIIFFAYVVKNKCYLGIDFAGFELNKRAYKIFLHPNSLRGTIAYALIRESGFEKEGVVLDPFSRDGIIPIEAAFYATGFSHNYYKKDKFSFLRLELGIDYNKFFNGIDKKIKDAKANIYSFDHLFKYVDYSRKNAKIAGVDKQINFSRTELEWLDIKFKKESVDRIITNPVTSKNTNLDRIYNEFFYQAEYILKKNGIIAIITKMPDFVKLHAEKHNFVLARKKDVWSGEQSLNILVFKKKNI